MNLVPSPPGPLTGPLPLYPILEFFLRSRCAFFSCSSDPSRILPSSFFSEIHTRFPQHLFRAIQPQPEPVSPVFRPCSARSPRRLISTANLRRFRDKFVLFFSSFRLQRKFRNRVTCSRALLEGLSPLAASLPFSTFLYICPTSFLDLNGFRSLPFPSPSSCDARPQFNIIRIDQSRSLSSAQSQTKAPSISLSVNLLLLHRSQWPPVLQVLSLDSPSPFSVVFCC